MRYPINRRDGRGLPLLFLVAPILAGCGDTTPTTDRSGPDRRALAPLASPPGAGPGGESVSTNADPRLDSVQLAVLTRRLEESEQAQQTRETQVRRLLERIDELEKREASRAESVAGAARDAQVVQAAQAAEVKVQQERTQRLTRQIGDLESQVVALKAGRVLPEVAVTPSDAPTTRELDQKLRIIERRQELAAESAEAKAKEAPILSAGPSGFALSAANTNFVLKLRGLVQVDSRLFVDDNERSEGNDTFALRRARPIVEGTVFRDFDYQFVPDFGGNTVQIFDANLNYRLRPEIQLRAGKFKGPVGLEHLQSDATLPFNERGPVSNFMPIRNVGVALWGEVGGGLFSYSLGAYNVSGDGRNAGSTDFGDDKELAGRVFLQPFRESGLPALRGLGFGLGGSYSQVSSNANGLPSTTGGARPGYVTSGLQQFFAYNPANGTVVADGAQWRLSPQLSHAWGPFGLLGEYAISHQSVLNGFNSRSAGLDHTAWQVSVQWVLTGEKASFSGINPDRPFSLATGGWGAWQLVGRYGQIALDDETFPAFSNPDLSAREASTWAVGVNWWLNRNVRLLASFARTSFEGGGGGNPLDSASFSAPATVTAQDENVFLARLQLSF